MRVRVQIKNRKPDFHFQLVGQTLGKDFYRLDAHRGAAVWGCWRKAREGTETDSVTPGSLQPHILKKKVSGGSIFRLMS